MQKISLTVDEAVIFEKLLIQNRDDAYLQRRSECSYTESINLLNKLRSKLNR